MRELALVHLARQAGEGTQLYCAGQTVESYELVNMSDGNLIQTIISTTTMIITKSLSGKKK